MSSAKVHISLSEGVLQIEGSEDFVASQIDKLEPHIAEAFKMRRHTLNGESETENPSAADGGSAAKHPSFDHVFAESDGKVRILKKLPGESDAEKTSNAAILIAWAALKSGREMVSSDEVREACKAHGCFNASNFASYLKDEKEFLIVEGKARSPNKMIRLTVPGRGRAEELFRQIVAQ